MLFTSQTISVANSAVFPRIRVCFLWSCGFFWRFAGLLVFGLCFNWNLLVFWACFSQISLLLVAFFVFYGTFAVSIYWYGILGVFLWKFAHFGLVFFGLSPSFIFDFLADFSFWWIFLPTHVGLILRFNYRFLACFSNLLLVFAK